MTYYIDAFGNQRKPKWLKLGGAYDKREIMQAAHTHYQVAKRLGMTDEISFADCLRYVWDLARNARAIYAESLREKETISFYGLGYEALAA